MSLSNLHNLYQNPLPKKNTLRQNQIAAKKKYETATKRYRKSISQQKAAKTKKEHKKIEKKKAEHNANLHKYSLQQAEMNTKKYRQFIANISPSTYSLYLKCMKIYHNSKNSKQNLKLQKNLQQWHKNWLIKNKTPKIFPQRHTLLINNDSARSIIKDIGQNMKIIYNKYKQFWIYVHNEYKKYKATELANVYEKLPKVINYLQKQGYKVRAPVSKTNKYPTKLIYFVSEFCQGHGSPNFKSLNMNTSDWKNAWKQMDTKLLQNANQCNFVSSSGKKRDGMEYYVGEKIIVKIKKQNQNLWNSYIVEIKTEQDEKKNSRKEQLQNIKGLLINEYDTRLKTSIGKIDLVQQSKKWIGYQTLIDKAKNPRISLIQKKLSQQVHTLIKSRLKLRKYFNIIVKPELRKLHKQSTEYTTIFNKKTIFHPISQLKQKASIKNNTEMLVLCKSKLMWEQIQDEKWTSGNFKPTLIYIPFNNENIKVMGVSRKYTLEPFIIRQQLPTTIDSLFASKLDFTKWNANRIEKKTIKTTTILNLKDWTNYKKNQMMIFGKNGDFETEFLKSKYADKKRDTIRSMIETEFKNNIKTRIERSRKSSAYTKFECHSSETDDFEAATTICAQKGCKVSNKKDKKNNYKCYRPDNESPSGFALTRTNARLFEKQEKDPRLNLKRNTGCRRDELIKTGRNEKEKKKLRERRKRCSSELLTYIETPHTLKNTCSNNPHQPNFKCNSLFSSTTKLKKQNIYKKIIKQQQIKKMKKKMKKNKK